MWVRAIYCIIYIKPYIRQRAKFYKKLEKVKRIIKGKRGAGGMEGWRDGGMEGRREVV